MWFDQERVVPQLILSAIDTSAETQLLLSEFLGLRALVLALRNEILKANELTE
ncbi:MAG: hypothetical protein M3Y72_13885 [Acidobacteriota bacterium]|nr:hypothetical protein [Acidobacteriota bacterium]